MTKPKRKAKKIHRNKKYDGPTVDKTAQKHIDELAAQFQEDQLKVVLRRCHQNVQKYGLEAVVQVMDNYLIRSASNLTQKESRIIEENDAFIARCAKDIKCIKGITHAHKETAQQNALFLIESSEARGDYDSDTLASMRKMYERELYDDVADLAYLHDRQQRPQRPLPTGDDTPCPPKFKSPWQRFSELLTKATEAVEDETELPLKCCLEAIRCLSRDLTYENRASAKEHIHQVIKYLEQELPEN